MHFSILIFYSSESEIKNNDRSDVQCYENILYSPVLKVNIVLKINTFELNSIRISFICDDK